MSALSMRDALAKALHGQFSAPTEVLAWEELPREVREEWLADADALISSGAVVDAATLADDEALVSDLDSRPMWSGPGDYGTRDALEALAAALAERGQA